jgi:hypothetical protein
VANQRTAARRHQSPGDKLQKARNDFILAMQQLAEERIPDDPHSALVEVAFPAWRDAGRTSKSSSDSRRFRFRPEQQHADERAKLELRKQILNAWARYFWLVDKDRQPVDWILEYAEARCQKLSGEWRAGPTRLGRLLGERSTSHPWIGALVIPMIDPRPGKGELFADFKKRARHALTVHLLHWERRNVQGEGASPTANCAAENKAKSLHHYRWLVLYQCCRWKLEKIQAEFGSTVGNPKDKEFTAIWLGLSRKAELLRLLLRPARD